MAITYTPTTNFGAKDSLPTNDPDKVIKGSEFTTEFTAIQTAFGLAAPNASPTFTGTVTIGSVDINGGAIDGTTIGGATPAAGSFTTVSATGNITVGGTVDGRDVAADGTKLDGVEAGADVTDTANVTAAGALMDSELTDIAAVKALDQGVATTDSPSFAGLTATGSVSLAGASTSATINFPDGVGAYFGTGNDLQIYHSGTESIIADAGTGNLNLRGQNQIVLATASGSETYAAFNVNGASQLYYDNSVKLATTSTGIDVTGTVTADGLTVDGLTQLNTNNLANGLTISGNDNANVKIRFDNTGTGGGDFAIQGGISGASNEGLSIRDLDNSAQRIYISSGGDISFYEDTGTTPKFFWDASAEALGIGTTSPSEKLDVNGAVSVTGALTTNKTNAGTLEYESNGFTLRSYGATAGTGYVRFLTGGGGGSAASEAMRIDASGNVGIGTSSPLSKLNVKGTQGNWRVDPDSVSGEIQVLSTTTANDGFRDFRLRADEVIVDTAGTERLRIDSSGNVGIGTSSPSQKLMVEGSAGYLTTIQTSDANKPRLQVYIDDTDGVSLVSGYDTTAKGMQFFTGGANRMRIDASGNVGIGTSSPLSKVSLEGGHISVGDLTGVAGTQEVLSAYRERSGTTTYGNISIRSTYDTGSNASDMLFYTSSGATTSAERMRIDSSGNVGISNSSPAAKLDIVEATSTTAVKIKSGTSTNQNTHITMFNDNDGGTLSLGVFGSSATTFGTITATDGFITANQELCLNSQNASGAIKFGVGSTPTEAMRIDSSGQVGIGTSSPGTTLDVNGTIKHAGPSTSDFAQSGYVSGQTISVTAPSTTEGAVYHVIATRHTGVGIRILEVGYVLYSANGVGAYTQQIAGSGISISVSGSTISNTNTGSTATIHLRINRI